MKKSTSLEKVSSDLESNARIYSRVTRDIFRRKPKHSHPKATVRSIYEDFYIIVKPKFHRSSSLSELTNRSEISFEYFNHKSPALQQRYVHQGKPHAPPGDCELDYSFGSDCPSHMSNKRPRENNDIFSTGDMILTMPDSTLNSSGDGDSSSSQLTQHHGTAFPFKSTPSGHLKVQSNQVVYQSSTVGVLLADPTQAKIKIKYEDNDLELDDTINKPTPSHSHSTHPIHQEDSPMECEHKPKERQKPNTSSKVPNGSNDPKGSRAHPSGSGSNPKGSESDPRLSEGNQSDVRVRRVSSGVREDKGKTLRSLGYMVHEPVDWLRLQLPKKRDLLHELYRRVRNYENPDKIVHVGNKEFQCHSFVLEVYSDFFVENTEKVIVLPDTHVTADAFQVIYDWMILNGPESFKTFKMENILDLFCAAQFLSIKDLEDQCWAIIVNDSLFKEDSAFDLYRKARVKGLTPVMDLMIPRVMKFFLPLVASQDFLDLEPEELISFLQSNYICVTSEMEVVMAGVRWLHAAWSVRAPLAVDVMRCVRFGLISPWQLVDIKRNPDNAEVLDIVNEPRVQQMVDDGLAYVIIKYWYGNNSQSYCHWIDVLGLSEPAERNWIGEEKTHVTYKDFLKYLEQFMTPKDQMYQQMAMMVRRGDDSPRPPEGPRPKLDIPLPTMMRALGDRPRVPPGFTEILEKKLAEKMFDGGESRRESGTGGAGTSGGGGRGGGGGGRDADEGAKLRNEICRTCISQYADVPPRLTAIDTIDETDSLVVYRDSLPEPQVPESGAPSLAEYSSGSERGPLAPDQLSTGSHSDEEKRASIAATYLAAATATLSGPRSSVMRRRDSAAARAGDGPFSTPPISLFNQSKNSLAALNANKLSASILGPSNKNYTIDGSLFSWERETVLVFGGIDPHTPYGAERNAGKDIFRFDPVANSWDHVGDLPEPRHHHAVAFLKGRVYLVGGADPRDDDTRGKSVVVSTVWSFEPVTRSWYSEAGLATPRKNFGLVVHRKALYAIGGQDRKGRVLRSVERFEPKSGVWSEVRPMGVARMAVAAAKYRDYIWVAGGMTGEKRRPLADRVECYSSDTDQWTQIHNLRFPRCFATLFCMSDRLYLVGGAGRMTDKDKTANSVGAVDVWDWGARAWQPLSDMSIPRHGHALAYLGTQLIIVGGVTTVYMKALSIVESYCCERGAWIRGVAPLPSPLSGHGTVTLPPASLM